MLTETFIISGADLVVVSKNCAADVTELIETETVVQLSYFIQHSLLYHEAFLFDNEQD